MTTAAAAWSCIGCKAPVDGPQDVDIDAGITVMCPRCSKQEAHKKKTLRCGGCGNVLSTVGAYWKNGSPLCRPCEVTATLPAHPQTEPTPAVRPAAAAAKKPAGPKFVARLAPRDTPGKGNPTALAFGALGIMVVVIAAKIVLAHDKSAPAAPESQVVGTARGAAQGEATTALPPDAVAERASTVGPERQRDADGKLTLVTGPDPMAALREFCAADVAANLRPVAVGVGSFAGSRVGIVRMNDRDGALATVVIQHDPKQRRWSIGNGAAPIQISTTPVSATR